MTTRLSSLQLDEVTPLLGSVARLVARGVRVSDTYLRTLLLGSELAEDEAVLRELAQWAALLDGLRAQPTPETKIVTEEALRLRGVTDASAALATELVVDGLTTLPEQATVLVVDPPRLDFGTLKAGEVAQAELTVQGGPGEASCESDQVAVSPASFGTDATRLTVRITPLGAGTLWTKLRVAGHGHVAEIPVVALWQEREFALPDPEPSAAQAGTSKRDSRTDSATASARETQSVRAPTALTIVAKLTAKPGREEDLKAAGAEMVAAVKANEAGRVLHYTFGQSASNASEFYFLETYADADALGAHGKTAHMAAFGGKLAGVLACRPEITRLEVVAAI